MDEFAEALGKLKKAGIVIVFKVLLSIPDFIPDNFYKNLL